MLAWVQAVGPTLARGSAAVSWSFQLFRSNEASGGVVGVKAAYPGGLPSLGWRNRIEDEAIGGMNRRDEPVTELDLDVCDVGANASVPESDWPAATELNCGAFPCPTRAV